MNRNSAGNSGKMVKKGSLYSLGKYKLPYSFLLPTFLFLLVFLATPLLFGIYMSFQKIFLNGTVKFVGFHNYQVLLGESRFINNLKLSLLYVAGNLGLTVPLAYGAALLVTSKLKGVPFFRAIFLLPFIAAPIVTAVLFRAMADPTSGPLTILLNRLTGKHYIILADPVLSKLIIIVHSWWRSFPFVMLFLSAGIASIPNEIYEAAKVDGASGWKRFRYLTFPLTKIHLALSLLIITMWTLQDAETVYALTGGGPGYSTEVMAVRLFKDSFINFNLSTGATIGVFLLLISVVFMGLYLTFLGKE